MVKGNHWLMNTLMLYFAALALLCASALLGWHTSTMSHVGGSAYDRKRNRRLAAIALLVGAVIFLALGFVTQMMVGIR
jgi:sugar phosphate permease